MRVGVESVAAESEQRVADGSGERGTTVAELLALSTLRSVTGRSVEVPGSASAGGLLPREQSPGSLIGRYVIRSLLGVGGMGIVYHAHDPDLVRDVAVKVVSPQGGDRSDARQTLLHREAVAMARCRHPNLVTIYDVGIHDGQVFVAMEYLQGETLRGFQARSPAPAMRDVLTAYIDAGHGLAAAHASGIVHGDFKASNVMRTDDGRVVVVDFGIARPVSPDRELPAALSDEHGVVLRGAGTPAYMAPELEEGAGATTASDQYAFALSLFEALFEVRPPGGDDDAVERAVAARSESRPDEPVARCASVLRTGMAHEPENRFPSLDALLGALEPLRDEPSAGSGTLASKRMLARPRVALAVGAVMIAGLGGAWWGGSDEESTPRDAMPSAIATPLAVPEASLGCPVLEVTGVEEPAGWLGAAASLAVCARATALRGGQFDQMLAPAQLLDLPPIANEGFPQDPYAADDARERTLASARRRSDAWLDGSVHHEDGTFVLEVRVMSPDGVVGEATASAEALHVAAGDVVRRLVQTGALPEAPLLPEVAHWMDVRTPEQLWLHWEGLDVHFTQFDRRAWCAHAATVMEPSHLRVMNACDGILPPPAEPAEIDRSGTGRLAWTALGVVQAEPTADAAALADELAARVETDGESDYARGHRLMFEGLIRLAGGDPEAARPLLYGAVEDLPLVWHPRALTLRIVTSPDRAAAFRAGVEAWRPDLPSSWRGSYLPRARLLAPLSGRFGLDQAIALRDEGRLDETRVLAARLRRAPETELAGLAAEGLVALREGSFASAEQLFSRALDAALVPFGSGDIGDLSTAEQLVWLAATLGHEREVADGLVRRYLLTDGALVRLTSLFEPVLALACAYASPATAAAGLQALERRTQKPAGRTTGTLALIAGARAYARGDGDAAVAAWRPLVRSYLGKFLPPEAFDAAGAPELGRHLDREHLESENYGGAHPAQAREATRCAAEGDHACARRHATRIVDAWSTVDARLPAVARMRALLAELPPQ